MYLNINYPLATTFSDYFDNESSAVVVYIMGCSHNCYGCQNEEFQDLFYSKGTKLLTVEEVSNEIQNIAKRNRTNKVCLEGGDPLYSQNLYPVKELLNKLYVAGLEVTIYTGYNIDKVKDKNITNFKYIKCGKYNKDLKQESKKTDEYIQLASKNQEVYDSNFKLLSENGIMKFKGEN